MENRVDQIVVTLRHGTKERVNTGPVQCELDAVHCVLNPSLGNIKIGQLARVQK